MYNTDIPAVGNQHVRSRLCGYFGGGKLSIHASGAHIAACAALTHIHIGIIQFFHDFHKFGLGVLPGIVGIKAVDIGKQDQKVCSDESCNNSRKAVVITETVHIRDLRATVSFSLTTGITPICRSWEKVLWAL